jgi:hypothetical protein
LTAGENILLGYADAGAEDGVVTLTAAGSIYELEPADDGVDLTAEEAYLFAGAHIGGGSEGNLYLETEVGTLVAQVGSSTIHVNELDDIELVSVIAPEGGIGVVAGGNILITGVVTTGTVAGTITMQAGGRIYMEGDVPVATGLLQVYANTGLFLRTQVAALDARVVRQGVLEIREADSIILRDVTNVNGSIHVISDGAMTAVRVASLTDSKGNNIGLMTLSGDILLDYVGAGSRNGQVSLSSAGNISETADHDWEADLNGALRILYAQGRIDKGLDGQSKHFQGFGHRFSWRCKPLPYTQYEFERGEKLNLTYVQGDVELFFSLKNKVHVFATGTIHATYLDSHGNDVYLQSKHEGISVEFLNSGPCKGDIELHADDSVTLAGELYNGGTGQIMAGDDLCIRAGDDIRLFGNVSAGGEIDLWAEHNIETTGTIVAGDDLWIKTDHCGVAIAGAVQSGDRINVSSGKDLTISAPLKAGGDLELYAKDSLRTDHSRASLTAGMNVALKTCGGDIELFGAITAGEGFVPYSSRHWFCSHQERPDVVINAGGAVRIHGTVTSMDEVTVSAGGDIVVSGTIAGADEIRLSSWDDIDLLPGSLLTGLSGKKAQRVTLIARDQVTLQGSIKAEKLLVIPKARWTLFC